MRIRKKQNKNFQNEVGNLGYLIVELAIISLLPAGF